MTMKPWRLMREQIETRRETRAKGHGAVNINLDLVYRLKDDDRQKFLDRHEVEAIKNRIESALTLVPKDISKAEVLEMATRIKNEEIDRLEPFSRRVSVTLLHLAVRNRYMVGESVMIPRVSPDGTKPGKWWGELQVQLRDFPAALEVSPTVAKWIVETWFDEKAQNSLDDQLQEWANVFETEMERTKATLGV